MVTFEKEFVGVVAMEVQDLLRAHYLELAKNQDKVHLDPDWDRYIAMERADALLLYTAREDGELIGYSCFFSSPHPHYKALRLVNNDVLFLRADKRVGRTGMRFIDFCEQAVRAEYPHEQFALTWHAKEGTDLGAILPRKGYGVQDVILSKLFSPNGEKEN